MHVDRPTRAIASDIIIVDDDDYELRDAAVPT